jgi:hypothetical protein
MGLFSFIGDLLGGGSAKSSINKATQAQVDAYNKGIGEQQREFDLARSDFAPYMAAGTSALPGMEDLLGLNGPDKSQAAINALQQSPLYQSLYRNGLEANLQNASATGGIRGGNETRSLADFGSDTLSSVLQNQIGNFGSLIGLGEGATNQVTAFNQQSTNAITQLLGNIGKTQATGDLAIGGINAQNGIGLGGLLGTVAGAIPGLPSWLSKIF